VKASAADSAFVNFSFRKGYRNLPMTSLVAVIKTSEEPVLNDYRGTTEFYNIMHGLKRTGAPVVDPETGRETLFIFPGDPLMGTGWVEGDRYTPGVTLFPGDRRITFSSGPFTMAAADTQEFLVAEMVGIGRNRLGSLGALRSNADAIKRIARHGFSMPSPLPAPVVRVSEGDRRIRIDWSDSIVSSHLEAYASSGYRFQGYNVYQLPAGNFSQAMRLATFDRVDGVLQVSDPVYDEGYNAVITKPAAFGEDTGLRRSLEIRSDSLAGRRLVNGTRYYYAVTSYAYGPSASGGTRIIESVPAVVEAVPQIPMENDLSDVQKINVYPNPYFARNTLETQKYEHFVTFSHLPPKAVINILALSGVRVRTIVKDDPAQFLRWDLTNESGQQVAAGMYVVYISLPELGTQKVLKLAVIPAATIPDHW